MRKAKKKELFSSFWYEEKGVILEKNIESDEKRKAHVNTRLNDKRQRRIVFARVKGMLGDVQYRFRGVFILDKMASNHEKGLVWKRVSKEAKTYKYNWWLLSKKQIQAIYLKKP